jgi:outer membrane receptor protein involved in Fe transport
VQAEVGGGIRYTGKRYSDVGVSFFDDPSGGKFTLGAYTALDLNGSVTFNHRYKLRAYVRNVTDAGGPLTKSLIRDGIQRPSFITVIPVQPRTIGIGLEAEF